MIPRILPSAGMKYQNLTKYLVTEALLLLPCLAGLYWFSARNSFPVSLADLSLFTGYVLGSILCSSLALSSGRKGFRIAGMLYGLSFVFLMAAICFAAAYYISIGQFDIRYDVYAVMQSNWSESLDFFIGVIFTPARAVCSAIVIIIALTVIYLNTRIFSVVFAGGWRKGVLSLGVISLTCLAVFMFSQVSSVKLVTEKIIYYRKSLYMFSHFYDKLKDVTPVEAIKNEKGELYVVLIGESETRDLMGCYNGVTNNTPWMSSIRGKAGFTVFENAYSSHVLTMQALRLALAEGNSISGDTFFKGKPNIISIARNAGMRTIWLSNQMDLGKRDNDISALAHTADVCFFTKKTGTIVKQISLPDEVLLLEIKNILKDLDFSENTLLVIHLMGNHFPYKDRYPTDIAYTPERASTLYEKLGGDADAITLMDEYMTSLYYMDKIKQEIHLLLAQYSQHPIAVIYFADHGEELYDRRGGGHNPSTFTWSMSRIPMWTWLSGGYSRRYPDKLKVLNNNAPHVFTNDQVYMLFLGLASITTDGYDQKYDPSHSDYSMTPKKAVIFNGQKIAEDYFLGENEIGY